MNKRRYPGWALPRLMHVVPLLGESFGTARGRLCGQARARNLTAEQLRAIAKKGVEARLKNMTAEQRSAQARAAAIASNAKRWAGHVKLDYNERRREWRRRRAEQRAEVA